MAKDLKALIVENSENDTVLLIRQLEEAGYNVFFRRVETQEEMRQALESQKWDIIFSDYIIPRGSGLMALELLKQTGLDIPLIIVSGKVGEDTAVEAMRAGASDFLIKGNLKCLGSAVARELVEVDNRYEQRRVEKELTRSELELRNLSHRLILMQEEEHHLLARELHDNIGHTLAYLKILCQKAQSPKEEHQSLKEASEMLTDLISQIRNISLNLKPPMLEEDGLLLALKYLIDRHIRDTGLKIALTSGDLPDGVSWDVNLAIFRIVQESITNVIKYARATEVTVRLSSSGKHIDVMIIDNGIGFNVDDYANSGVGIRGMKERASIWGGQFDIQSSPGSGTTVRASIPTQ